MGYILLEGGAEFGGRMADPDRKAIDLAGGLDAPICIIPAAAAPDHNDQRAGRNGLEWFRSLGATRVAALPLIDRSSANAPSIAAKIRGARLIYLLGGFTRHLGQTLSESASWRAMREAYQEGAVLAGSSAGAMVLCEHYCDRQSGRVFAGLGFVPGACVIPHHDTFGREWVPQIASLLPEAALIGIDEETGLIDDGEGGQWAVHGKGKATLYRGGRETAYPAGTSFTLRERISRQKAR